LNQSFDFPEDRPIRSVKIRYGLHGVYSLIFKDAADEVIKAVEGHQGGEKPVDVESFTFKLKKR